MAFGRGGGGHFRLPPASEPIPRERRGRTIRRITAFFRPYRAQVAVVTAAGDGCMAAIDAERWLESQGIHEANTLTAW